VWLKCKRCIPVKSHAIYGTSLSLKIPKSKLSSLIHLYFIRIESFIFFFLPSVKSCTACNNGQRHLRLRLQNVQVLQQNLRPLRADPSAGRQGRILPLRRRRGLHVRRPAPPLSARTPTRIGLHRRGFQPRHRNLHAIADRKRRMRLRQQRSNARRVLPLLVPRRFQRCPQI